MTLFASKKFCLGTALCLGLAGVSTFDLHGNSKLSAVQIIQKAVERAKQIDTRGSEPGYSYRKLSVTEELDAAGKVKERKEKVYEVSFRGGSSWTRLLEVNGHAPCRTDMKEQTENETSARHVLGHSKEGQSNGEQNFLTAELVARFDFTLAGETNLNGRTAYQLDFTPKSPEPPIHTIFDRLLNRVSGTVWIDAEEYELARAQLRLNQEVDLLWGVIGCLKKFTYTVTRARISDGVWLNSGSIGNFEGRKLLDPMRINLKTQNSGFRPLPQDG